MQARQDFTGGERRTINYVNYPLARLSWKYIVLRNLHRRARISVLYNSARDYPKIIGNDDIRPLPVRVEPDFQADISDTGTKVRRTEPHFTPFFYNILTRLSALESRLKSLKFLDFGDAVRA